MQAADGDDCAGKVQRCWPSAPPDRSLSDHVLWDCPAGVSSTEEIKRVAHCYGVAPGSINPNLFQDQETSTDRSAIRMSWCDGTRCGIGKDSIEIAERLNSRDISLWFADGSNYPGIADIRQRKQWLIEGLSAAHEHLSSQQTMLVEYKPFEPAFYHTDIDG